VGVTSLTVTSTRIRASAALKRVLRPHPAQVLVAAFGVATVIGTGLLMLPISRSGPGGATLVEALFTAVSAVCLTGLAVVDTATYWSGFGQAVILALIQIGGFGVLTFASLLGLIVIRRLSLRSRLTAAAETKSVGLDDVRTLIFGVLQISLTVEAITAVLLAARFSLGYGYSLGESVWLGVFHSVGSFNNAGFVLFEGGLYDFVSDPYICLPIAGAIILGGLGFPVIMQLRKHLTEPLRWSMNTRLVLWGTVMLTIGGTVYITVLEWNNPATLGALDWPARILAGFFHSVQTRSGGLNTVDVGAMDSATWLGMDVLMFIGAGPAGTGGGIKITTFAVLFFIILTEIRGEGVVNIFGKQLSRAVHRQAITVALLSVGVVVLATTVLMLLTEFTLDRVLFEAISAFGTVGLSTGITPDLPAAGQLILVALMFIGRLGPITFASALALRERRIPYNFPKERPIIG